MRRISLLAALFLTGSADALLPQSVLPLDSAARIRVWSSSPLLTRRVGSVVTLQADTLRMSLDRTRRSGDSLRVVALPLSNVTRLDVSRGRHSRGRGALIGALLGVALGGALGYATGSDCDPGDFCIIDRTGGAMIAGGMGAVVGTLIGALVRPGEKWERLPR
jgi:hypothetical protein